MEEKKIFVYTDKRGNKTTFGKLEALQKLYGKEAEYAKMTLKEWNDFINASIQKCETEHMNSVEGKKAKIKQRLDAIDAKYGNRTIRALTLASAAANKKTDMQDYKLLAAAEAEAQQLRGELEKLSGPTAE